MSRTFAGIALVVALAALCESARADYVELKDGTVLEGTVLKTREGYWVKDKDGTTHKVAAGDVKSTGKGSKSAAQKPAGPGSAKPQAAAGAKPKSVAAPTTKPAGNTVDAKVAADKPARALDYATAERRANVVEVPMAAVAIWQEFIDAKPSAAELAKAQAELDKWQKLADGEAEKIKGKWVGGDERKAIMAKAEKLYMEGVDLMKGSQTLQAVEKFKEAVAVYPNNFRAQFEIAYILLIQHNAKEAAKYLEAAQRIRPNSPEVMANMALIEVDRRQHVKAIEMLHKAAQQGDNKFIVQNLVAAISTAPGNVRKNKKVQSAMEAARLLASRHGVPGEINQFYIVPLGAGEGKGGETGKGGEDELAAGMSSGTGFLIEEDGLILTNRHVVEGGKSFLVKIDGRKQRSAKIVVIDDEQDLALIRVEPEEGETLPTVRLANADNPGDGAACTVMGFPLIDRLGASIKITRGVVSSSSANLAAGPDVVVDAKVNPGNSGGPILDKHGNVMAIVSMKTLASASEDTYGLGISAGRIRKFLAKNKVELPKAEVAADAATLDTEEIATRVKPATVCILATR